MCSLPLSDKGWLRQFIPQPRHDQLYQFIEGVGKRLDSTEKPTVQQTEQARTDSYKSLAGGLS